MASHLSPRAETKRRTKTATRKSAPERLRAAWFFAPPRRVAAGRGHRRVASSGGEGHGRREGRDRDGDRPDAAQAAGASPSRGSTSGRATGTSDRERNDSYAVDGETTAPERTIAVGYRVASSSSQSETPRACHICINVGRSPSLIFHRSRFPRAAAPRRPPSGRRARASPRGPIPLAAAGAGATHLGMSPLHIPLNPASRRVSASSASSASYASEAPEASSEASE